MLPHIWQLFEWMGVVILAIGASKWLDSVHIKHVERIEMEERLESEKAESEQ